MFSGRATRGLSICQRTSCREGDKVRVVSFTQHCRYSCVLRISRILGAPSRVTVSCSVRIENCQQLGLPSRRFGVTGSNNIEERFLLKIAQLAHIPLAANEQVGSEEIRIGNAFIEGSHAAHRLTGCIDPASIDGICFRQGLKHPHGHINLARMIMVIVYDGFSEDRNDDKCRMFLLFGLRSPDQTAPALGQHSVCTFSDNTGVRNELDHRIRLTGIIVFRDI